MERLVVVVDYSMEAERNPLGSQEEVGDVGNTVVRAVENHIDSWSYVHSGDFIQKEVIAGCRESREWGRP